MGNGNGHHTFPVKPKNVLGTPLQTCSLAPRTGFFRTGCCETGPEDPGVHVVCVQVTEQFLSFSAAKGNDLSTPNPTFGFAGLQPGDHWCLCAARWVEAFKAGMAPLILLEATHEAMLEYAPLEVLKRHAAAKPS